MKMYNLICDSKYYNVYNKRQMKKKRIGKPCIIATNKSKFSLQKIADNLNKKIPKVKLTILSTSDFSPAANSNATLNIDTSKVILEIEEGTYISSSNNCDTEQYNAKSDFNFTNCDNTNDRDNIKDSTHLTEDVLSIDENPNTLVVSNNNEMSDSSPTANSNTTLNIGTAKINYDIENVSTILSKLPNVKQIVQCCNQFNSTSKICENANVIEKVRNPIKTPKISKVQNVSILAKKSMRPMHREKVDNIMYNNMQLNNTYSVTNNNNVFPNANKAYVINNILNHTFAPIAESTLVENQLSLECEMNDNNTESDTSIISKTNFDDSFHLSDCSMFENTDEDENKDKTESTHTINTSENKTVNSTLNLTSSFSSKVYDDRNMHVETSDNPKLKLNMCPYCEKFQTQFARHLESVHKTEEDVTKFRFLPKGNPERKKIIGLLRRQGNFIYNTNFNLNKGDLIVCRRPRKNLDRQAADFIPCAKCKGFFSKNNIRHHFASCAQKREYPQRNVKILGRTVACRIHYSANTPLRRLVFPVMREDSITQIIRYDELLIGYGNKMCQKYRLQHQHDMIRARLRLLGRFLIILKDLDNITDFSSIYDPTKYEQCIKAVNKLAQFDEKTWTYKKPSIASSLGTLIKQIGKILRSMCIKKQDFNRQTVVENFLKLFEEDYPVTVNKIVFETQGHRKRQKNIVLPSINDIKIFNAYLKTERTKALEFLQTNGFSIQAWRMLAETTLISIMIFNKRRAGELERVLIENLENCAAISREEAPELYKSLSKYVRMTIRGKLGRTVPVLLHEEVLKCMQMIVNYRKHAGVPENNPYIFGIYTPDKKRYMYLRACVLMRKYSKISGAKMPASLRGTMLRKHIATVCISLDISEHEVNDLADFMGHHEKIHKSHYRQSIITKDLAISRLLKYAQGEDTTDESDNVDEDENENKDDPTNDNNSDLSLNTSDTSSLTKTRQSKQLPSKEKNINNYINNNTEKTKVNRLASKRKINHNIENVTESDDECNTELDLNILSSKKTKQSEQMTRGKNNVNSNTQRKKKRTSHSASTRKSTHKIRWTDDERTIVLSSFQTAITNKKLPSLHEINEIKIKYPVLKTRTSAQIKTWLHNQIRTNI